MTPRPMHLVVITHQPHHARPSVEQTIINKACLSSRLTYNLILFQQNDTRIPPCLPSASNQRGGRSPQIPGGNHLRRRNSSRRHHLRMSTFPPGSILNLQGWSNSLHPGIPHRLRRLDPVAYRQLRRSHARYRRRTRAARPQYPAVDVYRCRERDGGANGWCDAESDSRVRCVSGVNPAGDVHSRGGNGVRD